ncbi:MAG: sulfatase family protein [Planctomycetota bacterium]
MIRQLSIVFAAAAIVTTVIFGRPAAAADPPNFVLIFADDQGYQDIGCFGSPKIKTPNLDRMADEGMRFTDFYVGAPVCSASRASLLTGCYCDRVGVGGVFFPNRNHQGLNPDEITVAEVLKHKDYATACIGKWHLGDDEPFLPTRQGFDSYFGVPYSNDMTVNPDVAVADDVVWREGMTLERLRSEKPTKNWVPLLKDEAVIEYPADQSTLTKRYTEEAVSFIKSNKDRPFFLYMPHTMPHVPLFASEKFSGTSDRGLYGDVIEEMDWSVGRVLAALKEAGIDDNTLVIYTSDNGPWLSKGANGGCALPLRDGKFSTYEGGMREPCIMRWPGKIPAGSTCGEIAATIDVLPTFATLADCPVPDDRVIDGRSIVPLLEGKPGAKSPHEAYFYRRTAVRSGKWKLLLKARSTVKERPAGPCPQLYDLSTDISESNNLAEEHPEIVARLTQLIEEHNKELKANSRPVGKLSEVQTEQE